MEVFYGGLGFSGSNEEPEPLHVPGVVMTAFINYFVSAIFLAVGQADLDEAGKLAVNLFAKGLVEELMLIVESVVANRQGVQVEAIVLAFCKTVIEFGVDTAIGTLIKFISEKTGEKAAIDAIPITGQIAEAVGVALDLVEILETSLEVALSPPLYHFNLVLTHSLSLHIKPDGEFPLAAPDETLYYKVSFLFEKGTPNVLNAVDVTASPSGSIPIR